MTKVIENLENEQWLPVVGFEDLYKVSNQGRVMSLHKGERILIQENKKGYMQVVLCRNGEHKKAIVHRIVAQAFVANPEGKPFINHINGIKNDNRIENLEWCTASENLYHAVRSGLKVSPTKAVYLFSEDGRLEARFDSFKACAAYLKVPTSSVSHAIKRNGKAGGKRVSLSCKEAA